MCQVRTVIALSLLFPAVLVAAPPGSRLAKEPSPYLQRHAHGQVDWHPWGEEAFALAKKEGKLVFLSSGFDSCHWCHVMERTTFAHKEVAKLLNEHFICIKIDREERPDVDHIYLTAVHAAGSRGGWPLSVFMTADGRPLGGGSYFPPEDRMVEGGTQRGFIPILQALIAAKKDSAQDLEEAADALAEQTRRALAVRERGAELVTLDRQLVTGVVEYWQDSADPAYGGFGSPPLFRGAKFPRPSALLFLQAEHARTPNAELAKSLERTLVQMARGGIFDQLGGGFHRYSTERTWTVPHFEKMLIDNALLLEVYARAHKDTPKPLYARVLRETAGYLERELALPQRGYDGGHDADSEDEEGRYYVWTPGELKAALPADNELSVVRKVYAAVGQPTFEGKYFILAEKEPPTAEEEPILAAARARLLHAREKRERPARNTNAITGWNGLTVAGLVRAGEALNDKALTQKAIQTAEFVLNTLRDPDGRLYRVYGAAPGEAARARGKAYLEDYAYVAHGLWTLHAVTGDEHWLKACREIVDTMIKHHHDTQAGGFFTTAHDHEKLFARVKDQFDGAQPSGNSMAALVLTRLSHSTGDAKYRTLAEGTIRVLALHLRDEPGSLSTLAQALAEQLAAGKK